MGDKARRKRQAAGTPDRSDQGGAGVWPEPLVRALVLLASGHTHQATAEATGCPLAGVQLLREWATEVARQDYSPPAGLDEGMAMVYRLRPDGTSPLALTAIQLAGGMNEREITDRYESCGLAAGPGGTPAEFVHALCEIVRQLVNR